VNDVHIITAAGRPIEDYRPDQLRDVVEMG
jgi:hypothetical protein